MKQKRKKTKPLALNKPTSNNSHESYLFPQAKSTNMPKEQLPPYIQLVSSPLEFDPL